MGLVGGLGYFSKKSKTCFPERIKKLVKMFRISWPLCAFSTQSACFRGNNLELGVDSKVTFWGDGGKERVLAEYLNAMALKTTWNHNFFFKLFL